MRSDPSPHVSTLLLLENRAITKSMAISQATLLISSKQWFIIYCTWMSTRGRGCLMDICATAAHYFQHVILNSAGVHSIFPEPQARDQGPVSAGPPQWHGEIWQDLALSKLHFRQKETAPLQAANDCFFFPADGMGNRWHHGCGDNGSGFNERWWLFEKYQAFDLCLNLW